MDIPFIVRNFTGLAMARCIECAPALLPRLRQSNSPLKPFIATRLRGHKLRQTVNLKLESFQMRLRLDDDIQRQIYLGLYENDEIAQCRALVRPGDTCIDVGANVGWFSLHFAAWVTDTGRVISCEADPAVAGELRENCRLNGFEERVTVVNQAMAAESGSVTFIRSAAEHSGWGSAMQQPGNVGGEQIQLPATTLDELAGTQQANDIALLKIDVEGFEFEVLAGGAKTLRNGNVRNVLIEWCGAGHSTRGKSIDEFAAIFVAAGFEPSVQTAELLGNFRDGRQDPRTAFANLLYYRRRHHAEVRAS